MICVVKEFGGRPGLRVAMHLRVPVMEDFASAAGGVSV